MVATYVPLSMVSLLLSGRSVYAGFFVSFKDILPRKYVQNVQGQGSAIPLTNFSNLTLEGPCIIFAIYIYIYIFIYVNIYIVQRDTQCSCTD